MKIKKQYFNWFD